MSSVITGVEPGSLADIHQIRPGDILLKVNGKDITDVLDYRFYIADRNPEIEIREKGGALRCIRFEKEEYADIGLEFESYLMDKKHSCRNRCIFCFIDQLPPGLRETLYFKDDDARLSFLMGNYITLTNLTEREADRIVSMHISPVNVSVHTTNPELRVKMMGNKNAGKALDYLRKFTEHAIKVNCQIVLCKGVNDGRELDRTLSDLGKLYPGVESIAVVPVGLTRFREGLAQLEPFEKQDSEAVLEQIERFGSRFRRRYGTRLVFPADEFFLKAGRPIPDISYYEGEDQLENGVGLVADLRFSFRQALDVSCIKRLPAGRKISMATGTAAYGLMKNIAEKTEKQVAGFSCLVYSIENHFFGTGVTVAGLVTGADLVDQLRGADLGAELLIPSVMLRHERDLFLDGMSLSGVSEALGVRVTPVDTDGGALLDAMLGKEA